MKATRIIALLALLMMAGKVYLVRINDKDGMNLATKVVVKE